MIAALLIALSLSQQPEFRWLETEWGLYDKNTLFLKLSEDGEKSKALVFKYRANDRGQAERFPRGDVVNVPTDVWKSWTPGTIEKEGNVWKIKHPSRNRWDYLVDAAGHPLPTDSKGAVCLPPSDLEAALKLVESAQTQVDDQLKDVKAKKVAAEMREDLEWAESLFAVAMKNSDDAEILRDGLKGHKSRDYSSAEIGEVQTKVFQDLISQAETREAFKKDPQRLQRLFHYFTLFGEFRMRGHRRLAELYWATQSIQNRMQIFQDAGQPKTLSPYMTIRDEYRPDTKDESWMKGSLLATVLARSQYSAWNPGDSSLSDLITGNANRVDKNIKMDLVDFISNYEAGLIKTASPGPRLTHYVSPGAFRNDSEFPSGWKSEKGYDVLEPSQLPAVFIVAPESKQRSALISAPPETDQSKVIDKNFEGAIETRAWKIERDKP